VAIPYALHDLLPASLKAEQVLTALRCSGSIGTTGGETWLLELDAGCLVLTRSSLLDPLARVELATEQPLELLRESYETRLRVRPRAGEPFEVRPSLLEVDPLAALLARAGTKVAALAEAEPAAAPAAAPIVAASSKPSPIVPARAAGHASASVPSIDAADLLERVANALSENAFADAARLARELAEAVRDDENGEAEEWAESATVLELMGRGQPVNAFMQAYAIDLPSDLHDRLCVVLSAELERQREPLLACATLDWIWDSSLAEHELDRLTRELDPSLAESSHERDRAVAERVVEHFRAGAEAGDLRALRTSSQALIDLGRLDEAYARLREAIARAPDDFGTRFAEVDLLEELNLHDQRQALLERLCEEFPNEAEPAERLAYELAEESGDTPETLAKASHFYALALEREFEESRVLDAAKLLERRGLDSEAVALLESGHERSEDPSALEDFARELARLARAQEQPAKAERWTKEVEQRVATRERSFAVAAIALMVILTAVVLAFALLVG